MKLGLWVATLAALFLWLGCDATPIPVDSTAGNLGDAGTARRTGEDFDAVANQAQVSVKAAVQAQEKVAQATIKLNLAARKTELQSAKKQADIEVELAKYAADRIAEVKAQKKKKEEEYYRQTAGGKLTKLDQANWEITVTKGTISATNNDPRAMDELLHFDKYTEAMTPEEISTAKEQMEAGAAQGGAQGRSTPGGTKEQCEMCKSNCATGACKSWCAMRWCSSTSSGVADLVSQEGIDHDQNKKDVMPATAVVCTMCKSPAATTAKQEWCKQQGC